LLLTIVVCWLFAAVSTSQALGADRIYWANSGASGAIRVGSLDGTGSPSNLFTSVSPWGVALDPAAGKVYWTTFDAGGLVQVGNLDGTGAQNLFTGETRP
jgi:DNA-binding beta-propeller fold protein YncE